MLPRFVSIIGNGVFWLAAIIIGVALGKMMQYAAVDLFGDKLGFNGASFIGLIPYIMLLLWASLRFPRLRFRRGKK